MHQVHDDDIIPDLRVDNPQPRRALESKERITFRDPSDVLAVRCFRNKVSRSVMTPPTACFCARMKLIEGSNETDRRRSQRPGVRQAERGREVVPNGIVGAASQAPHETRQPIRIAVVDHGAGVHAMSDFMAKWGRAEAIRAVCERGSREPPERVSIRTSFSDRFSNTVLVSVLFSENTVDLQAIILFAFGLRPERMLSHSPRAFPLGDRTSRGQPPR